MAQFRCPRTNSKASMNRKSGVICGESLNMYDDLNGSSHKCMRLARGVLETGYQTWVGCGATLEN